VPLPDIRLPALTVSRRHCQVRVGRGGAWVRDLDSPCGIYVNDTSVRDGRRPQWLQPDDVLGVASARLRLAATVPLEEG
jgi:pSer/pThr/pTyr-binding forkhead associated (FHA) protein